MSIEPSNEGSHLAAAPIREKIGEKDYEQRLAALENEVMVLRRQLNKGFQRNEKGSDESNISIVNNLKRLLEEERKRNRDLLINYAELEKRYNRLKKTKMAQYVNVEKLKT